MLWTHAQTRGPAVHRLDRRRSAGACTFDFNVAATKYFDGLEEGEVPSDFLFSGTVFYRTPAGCCR